jgi:hypothetical protein
MSRQDPHRHGRKKQKRAMMYRVYIPGTAVWAVLFCLPALAAATIETLPTDGRNIYRLASAELDGQAHTPEIVGSTYDNRISAFDAAGRHVWDAAVGGFVFDLTAGDLDGDGKDEIVAACADGHVYVINADGTARWKQDLGAPVWQVDTARHDGKTRVVLAGGISRQVCVFSGAGKRLSDAGAGKVIGAIRLMRAGDFDGDGNDEVAVLPVRGQARDAVFLDVPGLAPRKEQIPFDVVPWDSSSPEGKKKGERYREGKRPWTAQTLRAANATVGDLNADGVDELIFNSGAYSLEGGSHQMVEFPEPFKAPSYDQHYNMRIVAVGDLTAEPGNEIVLLEGCEIRLLDGQGKQLGAARAPFSFTDLVYQPGLPRGHVVLGSSPNGDDNLYRLHLGAGWEQDVATMQRRGVMGDIESSLEGLAKDIGQWSGRPMEGATGLQDVVVIHHMWNSRDMAKLDTWMDEVRAYEQDFPYENLRFSTCFWPGEDAPLVRPDGKAWGRDTRLAHDLTREQIVSGVERFENAGCYFWVQVGHGCDPHCEIATIAAILAAAPETCLGFVSAEDEQLDEVPYYFEHQIRPILELCLQHKKRFILRNKDIWWLHWPADSRLRKLIFNGRYRSVILPSVEDSNSRTTDAQLAARVGLWLDGQVDDWCCRVSADWFGVSRSWEWETVMTGHPHLRYLTSQTSLGARVFMFLSGERARKTGQWTRVGKEGTANFLHLLGKQILVPPRREQLRAVSPVVLAMQEPTKRFAQHGTNGHHPERWNSDGTDTKQWAFDRLDCYWAMAPLPQSDVSTILWGRTRRSSENLVMTAPHGFVCVLPGAPSEASRRWSSVWTTDGDTLAKEGRRIPLADAKLSLASDLTAGAKVLPFHVGGRVFHQIIEQTPSHFVIILVDPGWLDPADREVRIHANAQGGWSVSDRLSDEHLGDLGRPLAVRVPAGLVRLLDVRSD